MKGTYEEPGEPEDNQMSWGRGSNIAAAREAREKADAEMAIRQNARQSKPQEEDKGFSRGEFTRNTGGEGPPRRGPRDQQEDDSGMLRRNTNNQRQPRDQDADNDVDGFKKGGPPTFSNSGRNRGGGGVGFNRGGDRDGGGGF